MRIAHLPSFGTTMQNRAASHPSGAATRVRMSMTLMAVWSP
jgi:hypothetical protein